MSADENRRLVEGIYAAFARWDLPAMFQAFDALVTESAERGGRKWSSPQVHWWRRQGDRLLAVPG